MQQQQIIARMIGLRQAATETGLSYGFLRKKCLSGELPCIRSGKRFLLNAEVLRRYLSGGST